MSAKTQDSDVLIYDFKHYDRDMLLFIFGATALVLALIGAGTLMTDLSPNWLILPATWWIGAMMAWGHGKFMRTRATNGSRTS